MFLTEEFSVNVMFCRHSTFSSAQIVMLLLQSVSRQKKILDFICLPSHKSHSWNAREEPRAIENDHSYKYVAREREREKKRKVITTNRQLESSTAMLPLVKRICLCDTELLRESQRWTHASRLAIDRSRLVRRNRWAIRESFLSIDILHTRLS